MHRLRAQRGPGDHDSAALRGQARPRPAVTSRWPSESTTVVNDGQGGTSRVILAMCDLKFRIIFTSSV
eukprot:15466597-Alexandrium_andersonii.AAC.1